MSLEAYDQQRKPIVEKLKRERLQRNVLDRLRELAVWEIPPLEAEVEAMQER